MGPDGRTPSLVEIPRNLHRRVHSDAVNVAGGNKGFGHRDNLVLHTRMSRAQVIERSVNLAEMVLPRIAVVLQVAVVVQVAIPERPAAGINAPVAIISKYVAILA